MPHLFHKYALCLVTINPRSLRKHTLLVYNFERMTKVLKHIIL